ncbi:MULTISPECIES: hypothetical protein [Bradyrhizobium]|nr:hypothetical protein [Bradyrhizobium elkanii]
MHLLDTSLIRVGNDDYSRHNNGHGLTTLKNRAFALSRRFIDLRPAAPI